MMSLTALYGQNSPSMPNYLAGTTNLDMFDSSMQKRQEILNKLKENLQKI